MFRYWRKRRKKEFFQRPFHFLQKYLRSKKKWSLKKQRHRSVWTAQLRIQKNQMMRSFRSMRQWTERMKQQIPTTLIIKTHRIPMVKFWIPRKLRIRMRKIRRIKVRQRILTAECQIRTQKMSPRKMILEQALRTQQRKIPILVITLEIWKIQTVWMTQLLKSRTARWEMCLRDWKPLKERYFPAGLKKAFKKFSVL